MGGGERSKLGTGRLWALAVVLCAVAMLLAAGPAAAVAADISGSVVDTSAQPLASIEVCAVPTGPIGSTACARTDVHGEYSIPGTGPGYLVHFYSHDNLAPGYSPQWYPGVPFSEEAEALTEAEIGVGVDAVMGHGGSVSGRVTSSNTAAAIEGVEVCPALVVFHDHEVTACATTDSAGEYTLRGLSTAEYRFEFRTSGNVNFVEKVAGPFPISGGTEGVLEAHLAPGVMVQGAVTEAGTGSPVVGLGVPYSTPSVCALDSSTEAKVKCTTVDGSGHYSLPGIPAGELFGVAFAVDGVEEGLDLHPDGYVRQYWQKVSAWNEATLIFGSGGAVFGGRDAVLTRGEEVFPNCEVASACPPPDSGDSLPPATGNPISPPVGIPAPPLLFRVEPAIHCEKGFIKVERIPKARCVKIHRKKRKHHKRHSHQKPSHHQRQTADRNR